MAKKEEKAIETKEPDTKIRVGDTVTFTFINQIRKGKVVDIDDQGIRPYLVSWREGGAKRAQWMHESQVKKA